jgi:hypothetical protein
MAKTKRVQVLMEPLEFAALERLARSRGASVADLIRDAAPRSAPRRPEPRWPDARRFAPEAGHAA